MTSVPRRVFWVIAGVTGTVATNLAIYFLFAELDRMFFATAPSGWGTAAGFVLFLSAPAGMVGIAGVLLLFEAYRFGWQKSALRKLLVNPDASAKTDWFYFLMSVSTTRPLFAMAFSFGLAYFIPAYVKAHLSFEILRGLPFWEQEAILIWVNSFVFYLAHRAMHTRWLWEIHRVHHSARDLTLLTPHRNHPIDYVVVTALKCIPAAVLGGSLAATSFYLFMNGIYQTLVHTHFTWDMPWVDRYMLITPEAHRIHHSGNPKHWDKNYGILTLWDRMFGTYYFPEERDLEFGFDEKQLHNTGHPWAELWSVFMHWLGLNKKPMTDTLESEKKSA